MNRWINRCARIVAALALLCLFGCASNPSARLLKDHPELRRADGAKNLLDWTKFDDFDFLVFYGEMPTNKTAGAGIYMGSDPRFKPQKGAKPIPGKLGAFEVSWFPFTDKGSKYYRSCLVDYQSATVRRGQRMVTYTTKRHVWAYAETEGALQIVLDELEHLAMFATRPADIVE